MATPANQQVHFFHMLMWAINDCHRQVNCQLNPLNSSFTVVRIYLRRVECLMRINPVLLNNSQLLTNGVLCSIFDYSHARNVPPDAWPWDIQADASALYNRLSAGRYDNSPLRGLIYRVPANPVGRQRPSWRLDPAYPQFRRSDTFGHNGLVNGQCWPNQLCLGRDGAHANAQAGVYGTPAAGAYSLIFSHLQYQNWDNRDDENVILFCGSIGYNYTPSRGTSILLQSLATGNPIRVFRAQNADNEYAPKAGIRYDGLYKILSANTMNALRAVRRFRMVRQPGQAPIRWQGPERRPTEAEIRMWG